MSDAFYSFLCLVGRPIFWMSSTPTVIGTEHVPRAGPCLIAATHQGPYDIPLLMRHTPRHVDFVSIVEVFRNPFTAWLYGSMNAFPLDRSRPDSKTVRIIVDRLQRSRAVVMFPEGGFRKGEDSVVQSRRIRPGIGRIAHLTGTPVVPCVLINSEVYRRPLSWLPFRGSRYGVIYGAPIEPTSDAETIEAKLIDAFVTLHEVLGKAMSR